jgi:hypothetical protein
LSTTSSAGYYGGIHGTASNKYVWSIGTYVKSPAAYTELQNSSEQTHSGEVDKTMVLKVRTGTLELFVDGVSVVGPVSDSSYTSIGKVGLRVVNTNTTGGASIKSFLAEDVSGSSVAPIAMMNYSRFRR